MDLRSSTRSRRSKSRTPFTMGESEEEFVEKNYTTVAYSENIRTSSTIVKSTNGKSSFERLSEERNINTSTKPNAIANRRSKRLSKVYKTSDYSSEDGENEVSSTRSISDNDRNRMLEDARKAADSSTGITALGLYRKAKQYWEVYPKTDWTYSRYSKDRVEIAPDVVAMPNMSRRHISSYDKYTYTDTSRSSVNSSFLRTRQQEESKTFYSVLKRKIFNVLVAIVGTIHFAFKPFIYGYRIVHRVCLKGVTCIYLATSAIMLLDTWLLRSNRNYSKATALTALCVIPFLIIGGWWISVSTTGSNWNSTPSSFSAQNTVSENIISPENFASKEDFSTKIVSSNSRTVNSLTEEQYEEILRYVKERINLKDEVDYQEISSHILKTETVQNILNEYKVHNDDSKKLVDIEEMIEGQRKSISELTDELRQLKMDIANLQNRQEDTIGKNYKIHSENTQKMDYFLYQLNRCCKKATNLEAHMLKTVVAALNNPEFLQNQKGLQNWLNSLFVAKMELENSISQITEKFNSNVRKLLEKNSEFLMDRVTAKLHSEFDSRYGESEVGEAVNISEHTVKRIVKETLKIYDADKTGLVDYAMEPMGGEVITTRCTEGYHAGTAVVSVFGLPLWYPVASPRTVITPGMSPGRCWAFQNFPGILVIKLMAPIQIEAFSYEHISKLLVPDGKIDSSPKNFEVYGLQNENDKNGIKLGSYRYDYYGEPLQFFASENSNSTIQYVELRVISNHGNPNYTCLYRFRVHGRKATS